MALFNRNKSESNKLPELEWYNESEQQGRRVRTWVLALGALITVGLLFLGLFFGGRWVYRQVTKDDVPATPQTQTTTEANKETPSDDEEAAALNSIKTTPTHVDTPQNSTTTNQQLANTGPKGIVYVFLVASALGTISYRVRLQSKKAR